MARHEFGENAYREIAVIPTPADNRSKCVIIFYQEENPPYLA